MSRVGIHQNDFFFSHFLGLFRPILAGKESMMLFSDFLNFFAIFLVFSITGREGTHRKDFFYFLSFPPFPNLFWLEKNAIKVFSNFLKIFAFFLEFSITGRVEIHRNNFFSCLSFSALSHLFWLKRSYDGVF